MLGAEPPQPAAEGGHPRRAAPQGADGDDGPSRINVSVRCRPLSEAERQAGIQDICRIMGQRVVILLDPGVAASNDYLRQDKSREKRYAFDQAFGPETGTMEVFEATAKPLIGAVLQAYNATIFAYGSTGAGKTFTMIGTLNQPGVMLRTVKELFEKAAEVRAGSGRGNRAVAIRCCFIEVYNETLRDLLTDDGHEGYLDLREDPEKGTCVAGVTETEAQTAEEVMGLLHSGNRRRTTEPTAMNVTSSRSHAVLQVAVEQREPGDSQVVLLGKLSMIDLAGSERASQTDNRGARLIEGANINRSLLALGNCINALASGVSFVPYRDSKLTRLLKDSLGGNCRTVMIANISPNHNSYEDTLNSLKYANRAKNIRVSARQNRIQPEAHINQYEKAIGDLRSEVMLLRAKLAEREAPALPAAAPGDEQVLQEASEHWKLEVFKNLECRTRLQRSLIEVDNGLARWRVEKEHVQETIAHWDVQASPRSPKSHSQGSRPGAQPRTLADRQEQLSQIDESIRENMETRRSIEERLRQNRLAGKELQAQLPHRVLNEDLRAFLELIQRVQVLEVERLELDHTWETQRVKLEDRDKEIAMLREQLRLRNAHIRAQRELLSAEQKDQLPGQVSLLGSTFADASRMQHHGPLRAAQSSSPTHAGDEGREVRGCLPPISGPQGIDWRSVEVPHASKIRGIARIQPPSSCPRPAPKGWREPPELRANLQPRRHPAGSGPPSACAKPASGFADLGRPQVARSPPRRRGITCPPLSRRSTSHEIAPINRRGSGVAGGLVQLRPDKAGTPGWHRGRTRSGHSSGSKGHAGPGRAYTPGR